MDLRRLGSVPESSALKAELRRIVEAEVMTPDDRRTLWLVGRRSLAIEILTAMEPEDERDADG